MKPLAPLIGCKRHHGWEPFLLVCAEILLPCTVSTRYFQLCTLSSTCSRAYGVYCAATLVYHHTSSHYNRLQCTCSCHVPFSLHLSIKLELPFPKRFLRYRRSVRARSCPFRLRLFLSDFLGFLVTYFSPSSTLHRLCGSRTRVSRKGRVAGTLMPYIGTVVN